MRESELYVKVSQSYIVISHMSFILPFLSHYVWLTGIDRLC